MPGPGREGHDREIVIVKGTVKREAVTDLAVGSGSTERGAESVTGGSTKTDTETAAVVANVAGKVTGKETGNASTAVGAVATEATELGPCKFICKYLW